MIIKGGETWGRDVLRYVTCTRAIVKLIICVVTIVMVLQTSSWAGLGISRSSRGFSADGNQVTTIVNLNKKIDSTRTLVMLSYGFVPYGNEGSIFTEGDLAYSKEFEETDEDGTLVAAQLVGKPLNFPNPFRQSSGTTLAYSLNQDMNIELHIYDMLANRVFQGTFPAGTPGALKGYNKLVLDETTFGGYLLSAGVYFFVIMNDGNVQGKGKMAVLP